MLRCLAYWHSIEYVMCLDELFKTLLFKCSLDCGVCFFVISLSYIYFLSFNAVEAYFNFYLLLLQSQ